MKKYIIASSIALVAVVSVAGAQEYTFSKNLSVGASGDDVAQLQSWLINNGFDITAVSSGRVARGYFGEQTRQALKRFQESEGLPGTGYFGPLSRARLHDRNPGRTDSRAPIINSVDAPTVLSVNESGTWSIKATDPQNGTLSYSVDWGDAPAYPAMKCPDGYVCSPVGMNASAPAVQQSSTFTHAYTEPSTYKVRFTVSNSLGLSSRSTATVKVVGSSAGALKVVSPNGGEYWQRGTTQTVRWNSPMYFRATYADIKLVEYRDTFVCPAGVYCTTQAMPPAPVQTYLIAKNISISQNSYSWNVGQYQPEVVPAIYPTPTYFVSPGKYIVQVCETGTTNCVSSDKPFFITVGPDLTVVAPNGGEKLAANSTFQIKWATPNTTDVNAKVDMYLGRNVAVPCPAYVPGGPSFLCPPTQFQILYTLDKNIAANSVYNWIVATDMVNTPIPAGDYVMRICVSGSTTKCDNGDGSFAITR